MSLQRLTLTCALIAFTVAITATPDARANVTGRASVASDGTQANASSDHASLSADGRYVAFASVASNLVLGDTNLQSDVFVHDRNTGVTTRESLGPLGVQGSGSSVSPSISDDGRFVAFASESPELVAGDTNLVFDIFVRDRVSGTTTRVSVSSVGVQGDNDSITPSISADGCRVAFASNASTLVAGDSILYRDVYVHDCGTGVTQRVSVSSSGIAGDDSSATQAPAISADGGWVVFSSGATNLVAGDTNGVRDIFVRDLAGNTTARVSMDSSGSQANGISDYADISANGRYVTFSSNASNLVAGDDDEGEPNGGFYDVFHHDRQTGATIRVSVGPNGEEGNAVLGSYASAVSGDGQIVVFHSDSETFAASDTNSSLDVFLRHIPSSTTRRLSVDATGIEGDGDSITPAIGTDGAIALSSAATNLVPGDTNASNDVFSVQSCAGDLDCDTVTDAVDNCIAVANAGQANNDRNFIDLSPPKAFDDVSRARSDALGDVCDGDDDNDGRSDDDEIGGVGCVATDPFLADTDGDQALDAAECGLGTDPNNTAVEPGIAACGATTDADGDKVLAFREVCYYGTDPNVANTDGDTRDDGCEVYSINADLTVNVIDLQQIASESGAYTSPGSPVKVNFDVTKNGSIDVIDLQQTAAADAVCP